jgi:mannitol/fructose-specific phosphotransferase system IIA component (Ntr-type)
LGQLRYHGLDGELRGILKEKGLRGDDPFDEIVARSLVIDLAGKGDFADLVNRVSDWLSEQMPYSASEIAEQFLEGTRIGATPVTHGVALPHVRVEGLEQPELAFVRCKGGVTITFDSPLTDHDHEEATFRALFFLASPDDNPAQHLRILAQIAGRVDDESFALEWEAAQDEQQLRETLLHEDSFLSLLVAHSTPTEEMIDRPIREVQFPVGCLVALLSRGGQTIVPQGDTVFQDGDRLTLIGGPESMRELRARYTDHP